VLKALAQSLREDASGSGTLIGRLGGDEGMYAHKQRRAEPSAAGHA